jgi:hypothetical protein
VFSYPPDGQQPTFATVLQPFLQHSGLPFAEVLTEQDIQAIAQEEGVSFGQGDQDVYTPAVTLWAWLSQSVSASKSCVAAVMRVLVLRVALGLPPCSTATGGYCRARGKLPERFLKRLTLHVGSEVERLAANEWRWKGHRVLLGDGTEATMPDTLENQAEYPQNGAQKAGLGFPMIKIVVLLAFASACVCGAAFGPCKGKQTGETALLRSLLEVFLPGDVLVADRYYCSYWLIALMLKQRVQIAFRLHQSRKVDYTTTSGKGADEHVLTWNKPQRPAWLDQETWDSFPDTLTLRLVRVHVDVPGWRTDVIDVVTTLVDVDSYSKADIAELYHHRWRVELDIRSIKQTLKMDVLTCQTPDMVRKEIWMHLLGYNLVRKVMAQSALAQGKRPRQLSFAAAVQTLDAFRWLLLLHPEEGWSRLAGIIAVAIAAHHVDNRPGRSEPRAVKRRPNQYPRLKKPRAEARAELLRVS